MTPHDARQLPYADYLQTDHWQTIRRLALEAADHGCLLCDSEEALEVHHRTYVRLGEEQLRDLVVLCDECHARHHGVLEAVARQQQVDTRVAELEAELEAECRGAQFLAAQVERAWTDGVSEGMRRAGRAA